MSLYIHNIDTYLMLEFRVILTDGICRRCPIIMPELDLLFRHIGVAGEDILGNSGASCNDIVERFDHGGVHSDFDDRQGCDMKVRKKLDGVLNECLVKWMSW